MSREMKNSGIPWIGDIPISWEVMPHKRVMHKIKEIQEHYNGEDIISLTMRGVIVRDLDAGGKMPTSFDGYQKVYPNNLLQCLFDIDVTPRCVGLIKNEGLTSPAYSQFEMHPNAYAPYYDYLLRYMDDGKTLLHLSKNLRSSLTETDFGAIDTCVPSIIEQQKIASFLDRKCAEIDEMIALQEKIIDELKAYKQSVITEAVTKGLNPDVPMKDSGIEWIGEIPEHWEVCKIKNSLEINPPQCHKLEEDTEVSYMPMECLRNGIIEKRVALYGSLPSLTEFSDGDIVMAKVTPCFENGNIAVASDLTNGVGFGSSEVFVFRCHANTLSNYAFYYLQSPYVKARGVSSMTGTGGLKRINPHYFCDSLMLLPNHSEQQEIAEYLDAKCIEIDNLISIKLSKIDSLKEYKKSIIYEYVTGKKEVI